jgi:Zn-dependent peptidase ImmA (M78 family)
MPNREDRRGVRQVIAEAIKPRSGRTIWDQASSEASRTAAASDIRSVRRRCETLAEQIGGPAPCDESTLAALVERVAALRSRPIEIAPMSIDVSGPCGLWIATEGRDLIFYCADTSRAHQRHIVTHELGHVLADHEGMMDVPPVDALATLFPDLSPALVTRVLARTTVTDQEELEAEMFASVLLAKSWPQSGMPIQRPQDGEALARLQRWSTALGLNL